ncbi:MAG: prohibitin family protein [Burkholderiales bacterium]|nr:prohibitin family protein [Burkholderiales bacterium]
MPPRLTALTRLLGQAFNRAADTLARRRTMLVGVVAVGAALFVIASHPVDTVGRGELVLRSNRLTGSVAEFREGTLLALPGVHEARHFVLRDQVYRPAGGAKANGSAPFQSVEGLSIGVDLAIRYAIDPAKLVVIAKNLPEDIGRDLVQPAVQGVVYKTFTRYTVREIFSAKRGEIEQAIEADLKPRLAADGIVLRSVQMGQVDLPAEYRQGMDRLLAQELETEKMRYTLELKAKQVEQTALEGDADRVRREKSAQAAASEQLIAAKAQEEAMKHVLPFKQKQIEQRQLEAEAEKAARIRAAEGNAQARRIEAAGEAESRQKLADAEGYRQERLGKVASEQMARDGALITRHPLLIQKTLADKLSDKITVIIAPPPADGSFVASGLLGKLPKQPANAASAEADKQGE